MTQSDVSLRGSVPNFYIRLGGDLSQDAMENLAELTIESSLHMPDVATLILRDLTPITSGQGSAYRFTDDSGTYKVGVPMVISIKVGDNQEENVFDGEIVEVEPHLIQHGQQLKIRAYDRMHKLARGTYTRTFQNVTDMDVVKKIAAEVGLSAKVGPASFVHDYVIQSNQTNLDFLRDRASKLGYLLFVDGTTLHCEPMGAMGDAGEVQWGINLTEFSPRLSSLDQASNTTVRGWDPERKMAVVSSVGKGQGIPSAQAGSEEDLSAPYTVTHNVVRKEKLADLHATGSADRHRQKFLEATGTTGGHPKMTAGMSLSVSGVSDRYQGKYTLSSVTHHFRTQSGYTTDFTVSGGRAPDIANVLASQQKPSTQYGFVIGIVTNNDDPKKQGRVKVKFPWLSEKDESDWARIATPGGGKQRGMMWIPEVNDEVLLGFELGDMHHPYVVGGLWNGVDDPSKPSNEVVKGGKTTQRLHRSRLGHLIVLDDSDDAPGILVQDMNGNQIKIDSKTNTLTIQMKGDVNVKADGKMSLNATQGVSIEGGAGGVNITGSTIKLNS